MAKALKKKTSIDDQIVELIRVREIFADHEQLKQAIESPTVPDQVKKSILKQLLEKRVTPVTLHILYVLVDKKREAYLNQIISALEEIKRRENQVVQCHVRVPRSFTKKLQASLEKNLQEYTGKTVELVVEEDPDLLGGMIVTIGDRIIDGSMETQLAQIQERLAKVGT